METAAIAKAVAALVENRLNPGPFPGLAESQRPNGLQEAYDLQETLNLALTNAGLGSRIGHKIGCTSKVMQEYMNIPHPCSGGIFETTIFQESISQSADAYHRVGVECEIAVRLANNMPPSNAPYTRSSVFSYVESCMAAIEIAKAGLSVCILEKDRDIGMPVRCGEAIGFTGLNQFFTPKKEWIASEIKGAQLVAPSGLGIDIEFKHETGYILNRRIFDYDVSRIAVSHGAEIFTKSYVKNLIIDNGYVKGVKLDHLNKEIQINSNIVIGAD